MPTQADHIQLIWDRGCVGTAQGEFGCNISVGPAGEWTPERLLTAAIESSVMTNFMCLADEAGLEILGYVSAGESRLESGPPGGMQIIVRPCVAVAAERDRESVHRLLAAALAVSPVARALGGVTRLEADVSVLGSSGAG